MPTAIRIILRAPPPWLELVGGWEGAGMVAPAATGPATGVGSEEARIAAPHLLQNLVPGTMLVPQELQNAIDHLMPCKLQAVGASIPQIEREAERE
jgi:hypothetical protein